MVQGNRESKETVRGLAFLQDQKLSVQIESAASRGAKRNPEEAAPKQPLLPAKPAFLPRGFAKAKLTRSHDVPGQFLTVRVLLCALRRGAWVARRLGERLLLLSVPGLSPLPLLLQTRSYAGIPPPQFLSPHKRFGRSSSVPGIAEA